MLSLTSLKNKKIIMIAPTPFFSDRGCHLQILESYKTLSSQNVVELFTYGLGRNIARIAPQRIYNFPWYEKIDPGPSTEKIFYDLFLFFAVLKFSLYNKPDYFYCHLHEGVAIGFALKFFFKIPLIFDMQGSLSEELKHSRLLPQKASFFTDFFNFLEKKLIIHSDTVFVSSAQLKKELLSKYGIKKIQVKKPYEKLYDQKKDTKVVSLPRNKIVIGYLGGLQTGKGMDEFLEYVTKINNRFHFLVMGYPLNDIRVKVSELGIQKRITLTGRILYENTLNYISHCDYLLSPKKQVFGQANSKLFTYRSTGKQVICYDYPEFKKILGRKGVYVDVVKNNWAEVINSLQ